MAVKRAGLEAEDFGYADELGLVLPQLVLGIEYDLRSDYTRPYRFKPGRRWLNIAHQTAGRQRYLVGTVLAPKTPSVETNLGLLAAKWEGSRAGVGGVSLDRAVDYRQDLRKLLASDCNVSHWGFAAGYYTMDLDYLSALTKDTLPADLDELIEWDNTFERAAGHTKRWTLVCLGRIS